MDPESLYLQNASLLVYQGACMTDKSSYSQVIELLRAESDAIAQAAARLQRDGLERVLSILNECKGKIILLGVGKSGIIAQKIAATTASTTVALAMGDALAMTLMRAKGLTEEDFASNHPAGQLGKRLTLRVGDLMHSGTENPTITNDASWMDIVATISQYGLGAVNVIDGAGHLAGIITDGDLRRSLQRIGPRELAFANLRCDELMTHNPVVANPDMLAFDALHLMEDRPSQINVLPVVDGDGVCVGLIRLHDIVRSGL